MCGFPLGQIGDRIVDVEGENTESRLVAFAPNGRRELPHTWHYLGGARAGARPPCSQLSGARETLLAPA